MIRTMILSLIFLLNSITSNLPVSVIPEEGSGQTPDHELWTRLLEKYVTDAGVVDYQGLKASRSELDDYLHELSSHPVLESWTREEQLSYWINAYNAYTIALILNHYPVKSIMDIDGGKPWDKVWIKLGNKSYSLNQIENEIIRPQFKEPRIHFAINCAAKSCPPLANHAWVPSTLDAQLEERTKAFINNSAFNNIQTGKVQVSRIFDWYKQDFGNLIEFLNKYSQTRIKPNAGVEFMEYNWALNGK